MTTAIATLAALSARCAADDGRIRAVIDAHHDALWRFLRRMGIAEHQVEDAVQQVLLVFAQRADGIEPGAERPFLFGTAYRVAADARRKGHVTREVLDADAVLRHAHPGPDAEQQLAQGELRALLDAVLQALAPDLRAVLVLAEIEELTMREIGQLLSIPQGTVASRLRKAREAFEAKALELKRHLDEGIRP